MSQGQILVLGAIAGLTIFLGLPAGRLQRLSTRAGALLSATATGILLFLLWDVLSAGIEPVEAALNAAALDHDGTWGRFAWLATIFVVCFAIGLMSLVYFDQIVVKRRRAPGLPEPRRGRDRRVRRAPGATLSPAQSLSLMIATGIGLHNFSEGLAIGQSAASGDDQPRARARDRLRPPQRHRGLRHRRPVLGHRGAAELGLPAARRADRRRADVLRDAARPGVGERGCLDRVPRARRRLDPLRRDRAPRRLSQPRPQDGRRLGASRSG